MLDMLRCVLLAQTPVTPEGSVDSYSSSGQAFEQAKSMLN